MVTSIVPKKFIRRLLVNGKEVLTDSEGYIQSGGVVGGLRARRQEGLALTDEHWEVIRFLRTKGEH